MQSFGGEITKKGRAVPARRSFQVGDRVVLQGKAARIERIEKPASHKFYDSGRYTIRYDDGSTHHNAPGYLMARPGQDRRQP